MLYCEILVKRHRVSEQSLLMLMGLTSVCPLAPLAPLFPTGRLPAGCAAQQPAPALPASRLSIPSSLAPSSPFLCCRHGLLGFALGQVGFCSPIPSFQQFLLLRISPFSKSGVLSFQIRSKTLVWLRHLVHICSSRAHCPKVLDACCWRTQDAKTLRLSSSCRIPSHSHWYHPETPHECCRLKRHELSPLSAFQGESLSCLPTWHLLL